MTDVIGIDHLYVTVSELARAEVFYDAVLIEVLGFRKNRFTLGSDPQRCAQRERVNGAIGAAFVKRSTAEWTERLLKAGVPCGPIHRIDQVFADPQVQHLGITWPMQHPQLGEVSVVGQPFRLSRSARASEPTPAPHQGDQTDAILRELGYDDARIAELRGKRVV